jgi:hypothetical protein
MLPSHFPATLAAELDFRQLDSGILWEYFRDFVAAIANSRPPDLRFVQGLP